MSTHIVNESDISCLIYKPKGNGTLSSLIQEFNTTHSSKAEIRVQLSPNDALDAIPSIVEKLWSEPADEAMVSSMALKKIDKGERLALLPTSSHVIVFCTEGSLKNDSGVLTPRSICYNPPSNLLDISAEENSKLLLLNLCKSSLGNVTQAQNGVPTDNAYFVPFDDLPWMHRPRSPDCRSCCIFRIFW